MINKREGEPIREVVNSTNLVDLLKKYKKDGLPSFEELPKNIDIGEKIKVMSDANVDVDEFDDGFSIDELAKELKYLTYSNNREYSIAVVMDTDDNVLLGPINEGDSNSVGIDAPVKQKETISPSGLYVIRMDKIVSAIHSHPSEYSFSLQDLFVHFSKEDMMQLMVVKEDGVVDLVQKTRDTQIISKETFVKLLSLWDTYLSPVGLPKEGIDKNEYNEFVSRLSNDALSVGFYSNRDNPNSSRLDRIIKSK
ncbi:MAG: hypothetical protein A2725_00755 [Candidatus Magasanikbacteria bacterium RIFCSPHIGHO2_01_FULL_33_34]|uniref:Uncharacterized protein n=1 Tax=Candidatus Magasanikbacteria bacterium RIFCSPHIGHO2_01_FULL_33_34 TaxID=1798671 RepID=A0A1F6LJ27_9BACT|nr:MAG: hypothetical protein A2725_00755 [Candidatus Magasanikbacteria bacterium RIFCSPHIGHO2_01_FULL_33_34]OGH65290.1 MAG: hypothetical protein A3B83_04415 [Candidatus Magasanikbacteria bacterium RIFCSPHIGHO2_02_FULL_33_17]OGH76067.1 MAG: hypothetical protein A3A89_01340 [Candidatus Magasanikbacteria bacterium RIFCSPLOWO2_01_FULL_33_34]OGH81762.1 MAG: hypothetical protein A3F93_00820 [Candidatus Magasanikbacteria bacterium RIFCSPLOWO2_12_FULL_34_7]